jgi:hypothetical protein
MYYYSVLVHIMLFNIEDVSGWLLPLGGTESDYPFQEPEST